MMLSRWIIAVVDANAEGEVGDLFVAVLQRYAWGGPGRMPSAS